MTTKEQEKLLAELVDLEQRARLIRMMLHMPYEADDMETFYETNLLLGSPAKFMPKPESGQLPSGITLRQDGRYMARFMYQKKTYTLYGKDPHLLKQQLENYRIQIRFGNNNKLASCTLDQWFEIWMTQLKSKEIKLTSQRVYRSTYNAHISPVMGWQEMRDVTNYGLQVFLNDLSMKTSKSMLSRIFLVLHLLFDNACKYELISRNPMAHVFLPNIRKKREEQRVLSTDEQQIFVEFAKADRFYPIFQIALSTGMRNGEIRALEWNDIDMERRLIHVTGTISYVDHQYVKSTPKSLSSYRDIPMTDKVYGIISDLETQTAKKQGFLFAKQDGSCLDQNILLHHIHMIERRIKATYADWDPIHFHTLRHTFATRAIEGGMMPQTLKTIMGHSSLAITMDLYSHVLPNTKATQMQQIQALL